MPFEDDKFQTVVAKRVIHHFDPELREEFFNEVKRVLKPKGKFIILEGTPGMYRRATKSIGFITGVLGEDNDDYGHLDERDISELLENSGFREINQEKLGSPLMPFSILNSNIAEKIFPVYKKTNFIKWWTLTVAELE